MTTISPSPFPTNGRRALSRTEQLNRANALTCALEAERSTKCSGQVFLGMFFDGTGNNRRLDYELPSPEDRKHSNIVRLFHAYRRDEARGFFRAYIPGVGTPFPEIDDPGKGVWATGGAGMGLLGEARILWGLLQTLNTISEFVTTAPLINKDQVMRICTTVDDFGNPNFHRRMVLRHWLQELEKRITSRKPKVDLLTIAVFGFSRGAAEARVYVNWLFEVASQSEGRWQLGGIPFRVQFLGIFDTVASVGLANLMDTGALAGHQGWADNSLEIHPGVEQCVHFVAGHEVRACFPLDSVRVKAHYPANAKEVMYPGAHSDVGGGYGPGDLGVSSQGHDMLATIPGADMYAEARKAGVPLLPLEHLPQGFRTDLTPSEQTATSFNRYLRDARIGHGPVEELGRKHMGYFFSYRFKARLNFPSTEPYVNASRVHRSHLTTTQESLNKALSSLASRIPAMSPDYQPHRMADLHERMLKAAGLPLSHKEAQIMAVARSIDENKVTDAVEALFDMFVHDSMAGFIDMGVNEYKFNNMGLAKFRTVFKGND